MDETGHIDHTRMWAPFIRMISKIKGEQGDILQVWDIRITQPNQVFIELNALHSLEHCFIFILPKHLHGFVNIHPYGCTTGLELVTLGNKSKLDIISAIKKTLEDVETLKQVPLSTIQDCGNYKNHSLTGAKTYAKRMLSEYHNWEKVFK